jgi:hypothetical protein
LKSKHWAAVAAALAVCVPAASAQTALYFGQDLAATSPALMPNAFGARNSFLAQLSGYATEGFESFAVGALPNGALFSGSGVSATITNGNVNNNPSDGRFPVEGAQYLSTTFNQRINFAAPVAAFGLFVMDANEVDNNPATVTVGGVTLTLAQIDARPFDSVDGIFRIVTERTPGVFETLYNGNGSAFPASTTGMFVGLINAANPFTNIILINGASGLDAAFSDGFGYDSLIASTQLAAAPIPEPSTWLLMALGLGVLTVKRRRNAS